MGASANNEQQKVTNKEKKRDSPKNITQISMEEIDILKNNKPLMVKIKYIIESNGIILDKSGVGFFCKFDYKGNDIPFKKALFTNYHILNEDRENLKKIELENENLRKTIEITKERKVYLDQILDYTYIEIFESDKIKNFFEIDSKINDINLLRDEEIFILQYSDDSLSFSLNKILDFKENKIILTGFKSNDSFCNLIIRRKTKALNSIIGISFAKITQEEVCFKATSFEDILKDIKYKKNDYPNENSIIAKINIKEDNYRARIINSYENAIKEGLKIKNEKASNNDEIKKCKIYINNEKQNLDEDYYFTFENKGVYDIIYIFPDLLTSTNCMFCKCKDFESLDLSRLKTQNVVNMSFMFNECKSLKNLNLSYLDTSNVENMSFMFNECKSLKYIDLSSFNTDKVKDMSAMFNRCESLISLDLSGFDTQNVTDMTFMFFKCKSLIKLDLTNFNTEKVKSMDGMFCRCEHLQELKLTNFNTKVVTSMNEMFYECRDLNTLDLRSFEIPNLRDMLGIFADCISLINLNLEKFNTEKIDVPPFIFSGCDNLRKENVRTNDQAILDILD